MIEMLKASIVEVIHMKLILNQVFSYLHVPTTDGRVSSVFIFICVGLECALFTKLLFLLLLISLDSFLLLLAILLVKLIIVSLSVYISPALKHLFGFVIGLRLEGTLLHMVFFVLLMNQIPLYLSLVLPLAVSINKVLSVVVVNLVGR